jgi:hypothetical protein
MGPIAATLLCYFEPERVYTCLVILHDAYHLHNVFNAGFPGMLEAIYVQERIMESYDACCVRSVQETYDFHNGVCDQVVYHPVFEFSAVPDAVEAVGCVFAGRL